MTGYEIYTFILCLIVYILLTSLSVACISIITKQMLRIIRSGHDDPRILHEYDMESKKGKLNKIGQFLSGVVSVVVCLAFLAMFASSLFVKNSPELRKYTNDTAYHVVKTDSMETKNEKNTYLVANNLNNQIKTFDIIQTQSLPNEMDLKLYDIVVYEVDNMLIVHRIVEIEEPNAQHPDCRYFKLQGDAIESPDRFPVLYGQMRAIYTGTRVPFIGSFVLFMQSPAGWLCILLVLVAMIATPIVERRVKEEIEMRLALYNRIPGGPFPSGGMWG